MKTVKQAVVGLVWWVVSVGCVAEGAVSDNKKSIQSEQTAVYEKNTVVAPTAPLDFELLFSAEPELCTQYLEMLNKTKYMEYPSCERKYLPEYADFQSIVWEEITDQKTKEDLVKWGVEQNVRATYSSGKSKEFIDHSINFTYNNLKAFLDKYEWHLYKTQMDMARDGVLETMYKLEYSHPDTTNRAKCDKSIEYFADDKTVKTPSEYRKKNYSSNIDLTFFYYKKNIYREYWNGVFKGHNDDDWWKSRGGKPSNFDIYLPYMPICKFRIKE